MIYIWKTPIVVEVRTIVEDLIAGGFINGEIVDTGQDLMIKCPFHKKGLERKASFGICKVDKKKGEKIYPAGTSHCYTCGYTADLPTLINDLLGLGSVIAGYKWLVDRYNYGDSDERADIGLEMSRNTIEEIDYIDEREVDEYYYNFLGSARALKYVIEKRKISFDVAVLFQLGYDKENDRLMIPVRNKMGKCLFIKERSLEGKQFFNKKDTAKTNAIFGLSQCIEFAGDKQVWICESEIDCMSVWSWGGYAIAIMGSSISENQRGLLSSTRIRNIRDGLDRDSAGRTGWKKAKELLIPLGFRLWNTKWEYDAKDINELTIEQFKNLEQY